MSHKSNQKKSFRKIKRSAYTELPSSDNSVKSHEMILHCINIIHRKPASKSMKKKKSIFFDPDKCCTLTKC